MGINFNNVETGGTKTAMPEGWYTVQVANAELRDSKNGPNTMINTEFNIIEPSRYAKRKVWNNFNLGHNSLWVLKSFLEAAGSNIINQGNVDETTLVQAMPGLGCDVFLEPDSTPTGDPRNKITNYRVTPQAEMAETVSSPDGTAQNAGSSMFK